MGLPPVPVTEAYKTQLQTAIYQAAAAGKQLVNVAILASLSWSMVGKSKRAMRTKAKKLAQLVCDVASRAIVADAALQESDVGSMFAAFAGPHFPVDGYHMSLFSWFLLMGGRTKLGDV